MPGFKMALSAAFAIAALFTVSAMPAAAIEYPWCVQYTGDDGGGRNCGFVSYDQCMMTARGGGAFCERNQFYSDATPQRPRKRKINE
jgi:hypothetical protein